MPAAGDRIDSALGHTFAQTELLCTALTHRSAAKTDNNERLEFLGDAVVGLVIADELFLRYPDAREGDLTRLRALLVNKNFMAGLAKSHNLGPMIVLGAGERKSGGWRRESILADVLEAVIGAIYLDAGMSVCKARILDLYRADLDDLSPEGADKDPKTRLQEWLQSRKAPLPSYTVTEVSGVAHNQRFTVECTVAGSDDKVTGTGSSIKRAEQAAAEAALTSLNVHDRA